VIAADAGGDIPSARAEAQVTAGDFEGGAARVLAGRGTTAANLAHAIARAATLT
jgi:hypothetical protein